MNETIHDRIGTLVQEYGDGKNTVFANKIGISEGNVRGYIKGIMPKADVLEKIVRTFDVNAMWLLTGIGQMRVSNLDMSTPVFTSDNDRLATVLQQFDVFIQKKDMQIVQQAEEIGRLRERISHLEREKGKDASDVQTFGVANVG
jgi:transcriptional regulator|nr:MAG TPA: repressor protein [Caudoviricetes sp.]